MFRFLRKHRTILFLILAAAIVGVMFFGIGTNALMNSPFDAVLKVNGQKITQAQFDKVYNQLLRQKSDSNPENQGQILSQAMNEIIREEVFEQEAKKFGILVTDQEIRFMLEQTPAFQKDGHFDLMTYVQTIGKVLGLSPAEFEKIKKKELAGRKVNQLIASIIHVPNATFSQEFEKRIKLETDSKKKDEMKKNPDLVRNDLRNQELNLVFSDWLNHINSQLKVEIVSENFKKRLSGQPAS